MGVHHIGIAVRDLEESLRFYCEGLGCEIVFELTGERDWQRLVDTPASTMRAVIVAPPESPACPIELIAFEDRVKREPRKGPPTGLFLIAFVVDDVAATKAKLANLGFDEFEETYSEINGQKIDVTFVRDPDGNAVEVVAAKQAAAAGV